MTKFVFMGSPFWSIYLNFGGECCEIRILSRSIQETYTFRKVQNFFNRVENQICLIAWSMEAVNYCHQEVNLDNAEVLIPSLS